MVCPCNAFALRSNLTTRARCVSPAAAVHQYGSVAFESSAVWMVRINAEAARRSGRHFCATCVPCIIMCCASTVPVMLTVGVRVAVGNAAPDRTLLSIAPLCVLCLVAVGRPSTAPGVRGRLHQRRGRFIFVCQHGSTFAGGRH